MRNMNHVVIFFAFVACKSLVAGGAIPLVPGDNSNYVDGEFRYVWLPDGDDNPVLVDLHEPADEVVGSRIFDSVEYWLYTRSNPITPQILKFGDTNSVLGSNYLASRPLNVIVHGYAGNGNSQINTLLTSAWLEVMDANIVVVDWSAIASGSYVNAVVQAPSLGRAIGTFLTWLINTTGSNWNNVHIAGFSLGGQIAGIAGRATNGRPRRITGLDPESPLWYLNPNAIREDVAQYVEIIHTYFTRTNAPRVGHVDFYPNGGTNQPGCLTSICSHSRSYHLFASSILTNHFIGRQCVSVEEARNQTCSGSLTIRMGNAILTKNAVGIFGVSTGRSWPF